MIKPAHHDEDQRGVHHVLVGADRKRVALPESRIGALGSELREWLKVPDDYDLWGVAHGPPDDFRVDADDMICLLCTESFYTFQREVNGG